ncbi:hypothetical protein B9Z55_010452 [Caenorhabditis nigoni]|uniref:Uncharacterized protein n=1 Tax=Caenorhabditis nigoni TaxID=1611254 RepID=A0A2G5UGR8_9PELO|nr:hypothetical protein B9Z55_010452 [Caenorhabditis nigoni]
MKKVKREPLYKITGNKRGNRPICACSRCGKAGSIPLGSIIDDVASLSRDDSVNVNLPPSDLMKFLSYQEHPQIKINLPSIFLCDKMLS